MKKQKIAIIGGCGHVGLPLGIVLATLDDVEVCLIDLDDEKIRAVNSGEMPFLEENMDPVLRQVIGKTLKATRSMDELADADIVVEVIGTPVDSHLNPLLKELYSHTDNTIRHMKDGALMILRSTLYPGVSKLIYERLKSQGRNIHLAVCPERIAEGKALEELWNLPQIVGAFEEEAASMASELFSRFAPSIIRVSPIEAELGKLFVNSWRYLNFAVSNQFFILCQKYNLDFYRIYEAFSKDYPRMSPYPKAGFAAGPCLLKDTLQLCAFSGNLFFMGNAAMVVNESLPNFIIERLEKHDLPNLRVAILGMAFKGNSDDTRDSLACKLRNLLQVYAKEVICTDPYVQDERLVPLDEAISRADVIVLGAPHSVYKDISLPPNKLVVDVWGFWPMANPVTVIDSKSLASSSNSIK
jgi:UDP-N-acetyl-D-mannosaminuronic acid dehydrogenase